MYPFKQQPKPPFCWCSNHRSESCVVLISADFSALCETKLSLNQFLMEPCTIGLPKIFGVSFPKLRTGYWPERWRCTKVQAPPGTFWSRRQRPKNNHLRPFFIAEDKYNIWIGSDVPGGTWSFVHLHLLGQSLVWSLGNETPKISGSPTIQYPWAFRPTRSFGLGTVRDRGRFFRVRTAWPTFFMLVLRA